MHFQSQVGVAQAINSRAFYIGNVNTGEWESSNGFDCLRICRTSDTSSAGTRMRFKCIG